MNKTINSQGIFHKAIRFGGIVAIMLFISLFAIQSASAAIMSSLDLGSTGSDVTELQTYLAKSASIYPSGLITGYFGPLTQAAVQRFQAEQGIVSSGSPSTTGYGRVGPTTMLKINSLLGSNGDQLSWDTAPILSSTVISPTNTSATLTWTTNELTQGQVYYDASPLRLNEATGPRQLPYVSGSSVVDSSGLQTTHMVMIQNLQPNTLYYYLTRGIDSTGNMSMTWPSSFHTNQ